MTDALWQQLHEAGKAAEGHPASSRASTRDPEPLRAASRSRSATCSSTSRRPRLDAGALTLLIELAEARRRARAPRRDVPGEPINTTENRAVLHTALRNRADTPDPRRRPGRHARGQRRARPHGAPSPTASATARSPASTASASPTSSTSASAAPTSARPWRRCALAPYHDGPRLHFVSNVDGAAHRRHARRRSTPRARWSSSPRRPSPPSRR